MNNRENMIRALSTFFYVGYLPFIPGTFASIAALSLFYLIKDNLALYILMTTICTAGGFLVCGRAEELFNRKDASCIVIDEVSGMLLSLLFIPYDIRVLFLAFLIFRILDTLKPYPAGTLQRLKGSLGVMSDDIIAGLYTNIILQVVLRLAASKVS